MTSNIKKVVHTYERGWFIGMKGGGSYLSPIFDKPIFLGRYSPSQNGIVVSPKGIALCLAGGVMDTIRTNRRY